MKNLRPFDIIQVVFIIMLIFLAGVAVGVRI